jgi:hypothetical protein
MMKSRLSVMLVTCLVSCVLLDPQTIIACRRTTPISLDEICLKAVAIVSATAVKYVSPPVGEIRELNVPGKVEIQFRVNQIIKGIDVPDTLVINGYLTDFDDFNDRPVPYDFVRPGGRGGNCFAYEYKKGAEFLLFLKDVDGKLTPYWDALSPLNEQLHSTDDSWLVWVQKHLLNLEKRKPKSNRKTANGNEATKNLEFYRQPTAV